MLTPLSPLSKDTAIEDLFDSAAWNMIVSGKKFNPKEDRDITKEYGKEIFAKKLFRPRRIKLILMV